MSHIDNELWNADIAPTTAAQRTWRWWHFLALWIGMVMAVPGYMLVSGLIEQGMSAWQAVGLVLLGNLIVLGPMLLAGHGGAKYGIPYAVMVRASFGWRGARLPALARAVVACGWYGIQTWIGGGALLTLLGVAVGHKLEGAPLPVLGIGVGQLLAFIAFWLVQLLFVNKGLDAVRRLETWTAPLKVLICALLVWWALGKAGGIGPILNAGCSFRPSSDDNSYGEDDDEMFYVDCFCFFADGACAKHTGQVGAGGALICHPQLSHRERRHAARGEDRVRHLRPPECSR